MISLSPKVDMLPQSASLDNPQKFHGYNSGLPTSGGRALGPQAGCSSSYTSCRYRVSGPWTTSQREVLLPPVPRPH